MSLSPLIQTKNMALLKKNSQSWLTHERLECRRWLFAHKSCYSGKPDNNGALGFLHLAFALYLVLLFLNYFLYF